jgi:outer membrane lipoprotein-sorting protein
VKKILLLASFWAFCVTANGATDATQLFYTLREKVLTVRDYTADVRMKIDVNFMHIPQLRGTLFFKSPDKLRLERRGGLSILPKKNVNITLNNLIPTGKVNVIDAGFDDIAGRKVRVIKVIPEDDQESIVLTKIWVDEEQMLALRAETTTRNDGTIQMNLEFGKYASFALPDKVVIHINVKDFKLPKEVTMDYDDGTPQPSAETKAKVHKGTIVINYNKYDINTGLSDDVFRQR